MPRVQGLGFRVQGLGLRVQGSGFRFQGLGFRVQSAAPTSEPWFQRMHSKATSTPECWKGQPGSVSSKTTMLHV